MSDKDGYDVFVPRGVRRRQEGDDLDFRIPPADSVAARSKRPMERLAPPEPSPETQKPQKT